jgi:hypothetical protein
MRVLVLARGGGQDDSADDAAAALADADTAWTKAKSILFPYCVLLVVPETLHVVLLLSLVGWWVSDLRIYLL